MAKTVHVTSPVAGFGNRLDLELVCSFLEQNGFVVTPYGVEDRSKKGRGTRLTSRLLSLKGRFDINLFLAPIFPEWVPLARKNVLIPNAEGFAQETWLKRMDLVLAKTRHTERIFQALGSPTEFTSFTCVDHLDESVPREPTFFHCCSSQYKGTRRMLETWQRHPEWPRLTAIVNHNDTIPIELYRGPNLMVVPDELEAAELKRLQNANLFHICCSEAEGFGHYLMEAMSCRAIVLTSDGPPMNELVQPGRGLLVDCEDERPPMRFSTRHLIKHASLEEQIERALAMSEPERQETGQAARAFFLENDAFFRRRFLEVMNSL